MNKQLTEGKRLAWNCIYNTGHTLESSNLTLFKEHHSYRYMTEVYAHIEKLEAEIEQYKSRYFESKGAVLSGVVGMTEVEYEKLITENKKFKDALIIISKNTYGTECCNTEEENNEILARDMFWHQSIAREALKGSE